MKIGFDAKRAFCNSSGLGSYSRSLIDGISKYFPNDELYLFSPKKGDQYQNIPEKARTIFAESFGVAWRSFGITKDISKAEVNIYHGLSNELPFGIEKIPVKSVVSIHDVLFKRFPSHYPYIDRKIYDVKTRNACKHATKIIAISEQTKRDLIDFYSIEAARVEVVYQTCDVQYQQNKIIPPPKELNLPDRYILSVGSLVERKNHSTLIRAFKNLDDDLHLVIVGRGKLKESLTNLSRDLELQDKVHILDSISNEILPSIYHGAELFMLPSKFEGFGIPIIEAMMSKVPVIVGKNGCFPEVAGPDSIYVDQSNAEEIHKAIALLIENAELRKSISSSSFEYSKKFRIEEVTKKLHSVYERV